MPYRRLAAEDDLLIVVDDEGLVIMKKQSTEYRRHVTERLHGALSNDRFVTLDKQQTQEEKKDERMA
jgi:hypothetical protein